MPEIVESKVSSRKLAGKYLTFILQQESYGIDVLKVREIIRLTDITPVPKMPHYVKGVINLRGKIIPVIDLRLRFGFDDTKNTEHTCIIVVQTTERKVQMGLMVDGVEEVANLVADDIEETPDFGETISTEYILGMAKVRGIVKTLLNIDHVISADAAAKIQTTITT